MGKLEKPVSLSAHCREHDHHLISFLARALNAICDMMNTFDCSHGCSAIFLYDERHNNQLPRENSFAGNLVASWEGPFCAFTVTSSSRFTPALH